MLPKKNLTTIWQRMQCVAVVLPNYRKGNKNNIWRHLVQIVVSQCRVDEAVEPLGIELGL